MDRQMLELHQYDMIYGPAEFCYLLLSTATF